MGNRFTREALPWPGFSPIDPSIQTARLKRAAVAVCFSLIRRRNGLVKRLKRMFRTVYRPEGEPNAQDEDKVSREKAV